MGLGGFKHLQFRNYNHDILNYSMREKCEVVKKPCIRKILISSKFSFPIKYIEKRTH